MKIAYIYFSMMTLSGVNKKPPQQASALSRLGIKKFDIYVVNSELEKDYGNLKYVKYKLWPGFLKYFDYFIRHNFWKYRIIEKNIPLEEYDYIILRYPKADISGKKFMEGNNVILECHSNILDELKIEIKNAKAPVKLFKMIRYWMEKKYCSRMFDKAKAVLCVAKSVEKYIKFHTSKNIATEVISNGISVADIKLTSYKNFDGKYLNIIFVGSKYMPWFGIERIINSIRVYKGNVIIKLNIIGSFEGMKNKYNNDNVIFHGIKEGEELDDIYKKMNIAAGTMALYLLNMHEGSTLKIREYIARGIPFIMAYKEADLEGHAPEKKFYFEFSNDGKLIDFEKVIDFIKEINKKYPNKEISDYMRDYALKHLDWSVKMEEYVKFVDITKIKEQKNINT